MLEHDFSESEARVLHVCWEFPPEVAGGMGVACAGLVGALRRKIGVRVLVRNVEGETDERLVDGGYGAGYDVAGGELSDALRDGLVDFFKDDFLNLDGMLGEVLRFNKEVFCDGYGGEGIVHVHDWLGVLAGVGLKEREGCGLVVHFHSLAVDRAGGVGGGVMGEIEQFGMDRADVVVVVSEYAKRVLLLNYVVDEGKVRVVWNGMDGAWGRIRKAGAVRRILFLGRMTGQKSPEFMLEVGRELVRRRGEVVVMFAGRGERLAGLRAVVDFLGLGERLRVMGWVPQGAVRGLLEGVDLICVPSVAEPFGLVAMEAALAGVGVVVSDRCGASEVLVSAEVVAWGDRDGWVERVEGLLDDDEALRDHKRRVQKEAASRLWRDAAKEILGMYRELGLFASSDSDESDY